MKKEQNSKAQEEEITSMVKAFRKRHASRRQCLSRPKVLAKAAESDYTTPLLHSSGQRPCRW